MNHVYLTLVNRIKEFTDRPIYSGEAPKDAPYPYAVVTLSAVDNTEKDRDDYILEVRCWDKRTSPSHAYAVSLANEVRDALLNFRHLDEKQLIIVGRPSVGNIPDPNEQIKRYDVRALIMTYRR